MRILRLALCGVLALGLASHVVGTFAGYEIGSEVFVCSLSGAAFVGAVIALNLPAGGDPRLLRKGAVALAFGRAMGNVLDPRVLIHALAALGLLVPDVRELLSRGPGGRGSSEAGATL